MKSPKISDISKSSIIVPIKNRFKNPIVLSFMISFALINWKPLSIFILSNRTIEDRINYITSNYYSDTHGHWYSLVMFLVAPLVSAVVYTIGLPRLQSVFENINAKPKREDILREGKLVLAEYENQKAYAEKQSEIENTKANYREVQDLNQQIELLNNQLDDRNKTIKNYVLDVKGMKNKIDDLTFGKELAQSKLNLIIASHSELIDQLDNFAGRFVTDKNLNGKVNFDDVITDFLSIDRLPIDMRNWFTNDIERIAENRLAYSDDFLTITLKDGYDEKKVTALIKDLLSSLGVSIFNAKNDISVNQGQFALYINTPSNYDFENIEIIISSIEGVELVSFG